MPVVEKTSGNEVDIRGIGDFVVGDRAEVSAEEAAYLVDERGDFELVEDIEARNEEVKEALLSGSEEADDEPTNATLEEVIDSGACPWCDDYEGDAVGQHASSAHPDEWTAYKED